MECPKCKSNNLTERSWDTVASPLERASLTWARMHPIASLAGAIFAGGSLGAKYFLSKVWSCGVCGHMWRKWNL